MQFTTRVAALAAALSIVSSLGACGRAVSDGSSGASEVGASEAGASEAGEAGETGTQTLEQCFMACEVRAQNTEMRGLCDFDWRGGIDCRGWCETESHDLSVEAFGAALGCVETDPLCFQTLESCICAAVTPQDNCFDP